MKYLIGLTLAVFLTGCFGPECELLKAPKFKFGDMVTITSGFYEGLTGYVEGYLKKQCYSHVYNVNATVTVVPEVEEYKLVLYGE